MGITVGIDLGTTNSVVCIKKISTNVVRNAEGDDRPISGKVVRARVALCRFSSAFVRKHGLHCQTNRL